MCLLPKEWSTLDTARVYFPKSDTSLRTTSDPPMPSDRTMVRHFVMVISAAMWQLYEREKRIMNMILGEIGKKYVSVWVRKRVVRTGLKILRCWADMKVACECWSVLSFPPLKAL